MGNWIFVSAETLVGLRENLKKVIDTLTETDSNVTSISSGCELFLRFITPNWNISGEPGEELLNLQFQNLETIVVVHLIAHKIDIILSVYKERIYI